MTSKIKEISTYFIISALFLVAFFVSIHLFLKNNNYATRIFIFPSVESGSYVVEKRRVTKNPVQGDINLYIDEILLGSCVERTKMLFSQGTKVESCFLRNNVLYLNLSEDLLKIQNNALVINDGISLLQKNILKNFQKVDKIELYIGGKYAVTL